MATFLNLPAEIRNYIYDLSGCVMLYQCGRCTRMRRGDDHEDRCDLLVDDCHFFMFSPEYQCCRYDNTPSTHDGKSMNVCAGYHSVAFWVNRKSHLAKSAATIEGPKGKTNSNEKKKGHQKFLRSTSTCGMTCKPWDHGQGHVIEIAQPNVTRTCKQVRADTLPTFYGSHAFILTLFDIEEDAKSITSWLEMIGPANAGMLRNLKVVYRKKQDIKYVEYTLKPKLRASGVRIDDGVVDVVRLGYPFCFCGTCIVKAVGCAHAHEDAQKHDG